MMKFNKTIIASVLAVSSFILPAGAVTKVDKLSTVYAEESEAPHLIISAITNQNSNMTFETSPHVDVKIYVDDVEIYARYITESNPYEIEFTEWGLSRLTAGSVVKVTATNADNVTTERQVVVTDRAPLTVTLSKIYDWSTSFTGKTEPFAKVEYELGSRGYGQVTANHNGEFAFQIDNKYADTTIRIKVTAVDGVVIENKVFNIIDTKKPKLTVNKISNKTTIIKGTTPGDRDINIKVYVNGKEKYSMKSNAFGNYSKKIAKQKAGTKLKITATDSAGNKTTKNSTVADKIAPKTPTVNKVYKTAKKVTGKAEKKSTVYVYKGKKYLGKTTANSKGKFTVKIAKQKAGSKLSVYAKDQAKNKSKTKKVTVKS